LDRAASHLEKKAYRHAHADCMEALKRDPGEPRAYYLLGILTADHANHAKAIDLFDRALTLSPQHPEVLAQKARSEMALLRRESAVRSADAAAVLAPDDALTLDTLGVVYSRA
ncbi:unnamed protein product, partial [Scytosiphon promiscuus]